MRTAVLLLMVFAGQVLAQERPRSPNDRIFDLQEVEFTAEQPWGKKLSRRSCNVKSEVFIARELPVSAELAGQSAPAMSTQPLAPDSA